MRSFMPCALCAVSVLAAAPAGHAQGLNAGGLKRLPGVEPAETSPLRRLPTDAHAWIAEERARQLAAPGDLVELAFDIEQNIGDAIIKIARRERIDTRDIILVVMHDIVTGAAKDLDDQLRQAGPGEVAEMTVRKAVLGAKIDEINKNQTVVSRALARAP